MATVLFLYIKDQGEDAEKLKDCLQTHELARGFNFISILDVVAEDCELFGALKESKCVVLVNSEKAARMIEEGVKELEEGVTTFDGKVIRDFLHNRQYLKKLILVFLGETGCNQWIPTGLDGRRVFTIAGNIQKGNPVLHFIMDAIKLVVQNT